jgi:hypothetical protein
MATITIYEKQINEGNKRTKFVEKIKYQDQPCRISFSSFPTTNDSDSVASLKQTVKLFIAPDLEIPAGCKITVKQNNTTTDYCCSGKPAIYSSHQEVNLKLFEGWA